MPCFYPIKGWRSRTPGASGKYSVVFTPTLGFRDLPMEVPCGQCIGCRLERSRQWAMRCVHEASLYDRNCFITLTYDDNHLPLDHGLDKSAFPKFMKRLRKKFGTGVRYFHCGEYGEQFGRPHYHACLFNFDFYDKKIWKVGVGDVPLYSSDVLASLWPFGFGSIGEVTFESAAYVARYVMKKVTGVSADEHYVWIDDSTGEFFKRTPEYTTMSRRPGIGREWFNRYRSDVYPDDFVVMRGVKMKPPKYYKLQYELDSPIEAKRLANKRLESAVRRAGDATRDRLQVRERIVRSRVSQLKRGLT